jgi:LIVCS family branched-chain amino acid:cation transporter
MSTSQSIPAQKTAAPSLITTGLALFSMFFGAGNLIFPLLMGESAGGNVWFMIAGLALTAVIVPFLGLAAMVLFQADYHRFFGRIGKIPGALLLLLLQLILGPFGVIPRLVTLMHAMAGPYLGDMPLVVFSVAAAVIIFGCSFQRKRLIGFLGAILTPILLLSLAALVFLGLTGVDSLPPSSLPAGDSFLQGLLGGYNTMDLIAAFLFATVVLPHFRKETELVVFPKNSCHLDHAKAPGLSLSERGVVSRQYDPPLRQLNRGSFRVGPSGRNFWERPLEHPIQRGRSLLKKMVFSSLIAALLLFTTYVGLCLISAHHGGGLSGCPPEQMLSAIAIKLLGPSGGCIAAVAVITACLTTAITLASIFADYLRKDLCKGKINPSMALLLTLAMTTVFANLGFEGIAAFLGPILQIVYPGLILLTVLNLLYALYGYSMVKIPVFLMFAVSAIIYSPYAKF